MKRLAISFLFFFGLVLQVEAQTDSFDKKLQKVTKRITSEKYQLRYKLKPGETVRYRVEQLATVDTTIADGNQKAKTRNASVRSLQIKDQSKNGNTTFDHTIEEVDMWSEVSGRKPVRYNSKTDKKPPVMFENVAKSVGQPISRVTMDSCGAIVKRVDKFKQANLGMGGLSIPLPKESIAVGHQWSTPMSVKVRLEDLRIKEIKTRELYTLKKVSAGVATISIKTQILTPVRDAKVRSQLIQRISEGEIRFDIDAGRLISRRLDWDETVLGFNGPDSNMKYLARLTEELVTEKKAKTAARNAISKK